MWIHPNISSDQVMHPIKHEKNEENEKEFYRSFKLTLKEIFPTIYFGKCTSFSEMTKHIQDLQ